MSRIRIVFSAYLLFGLVFFGFVAQQAEAQGTRRNSEREVRRIVRSLNAKVDDFSYKLSYEANDNSGNGQNSRDLSTNLRTLGDKIHDFETKFDSRRENAADVSEILGAAKNVNDFVNSNRLSSKTQDDWATVRTLLEQLASNYNVASRWDNNSDNSGYSDDSYNRYPNTNSDNRNPTNNRFPNNNYPPSAQTNSYNFALTGTYRLDTSRSENTNDIAARAIRNGNVRKNPGAQTDLQNKLEAPEQIAVDVRGNQVTLASNRAPQPITFTADGRDRTEQNADGRTLRVRSTLRGQELTVSSLGGDTDYTVVFASIDNGKSMRITRRITTDYLSQTVFAESVYTKTDSATRLGTDNNSTDANGSYSSSDSSDSSSSSYPNNSTSDNYPNDSNDYPTTKRGRTGNFVVPNETILTGTLQNDVSTKYSQNNDRFRMTVTAPNEFRGAVVEGHISGLNRSGKVSGRSQIALNFETIRLSNGQTYDFAGFLQNVTDARGNNVRVDTEGTAKGSSKTKETVKRGGIGAGIGAIIGAIAGGAPGAAIGAVIGGGAGAGSVVLQGKDDLELKSGSSITVQASSPIR